MSVPIFDPLGETDYGDWEDPFVHKLLRGCPGCARCARWGDKTDHQLRAQRVNLVVGLRLRDRPEPTAREIAQEDRAYWDND